MESFSTGMLLIFPWFLKEIRKLARHFYWKIEKYKESIVADFICISSSILPAQQMSIMYSECSIFFRQHCLYYCVFAFSGLYCHGYQDSRSRQAAAGRPGAAGPGLAAQEVAPSSIWKSLRKKYVLLCCLCGGLCLTLGILYLVIYFVLGRYTTSLHYFQTLPLYIPSIVVSKQCTVSRFSWYFHKMTIRISCPLCTKRPRQHCTT